MIMSRIKDESNTMTNLFNIDLTINMPDGGRRARKLLNMYTTDMPVDLNETAYSLCDADGALQARKFAKLTLKRVEVWSSQEGSLKIFALLSVSGEDPTFIKQVFAQYMDSFPDYLKRASGRYFSHAGFPPEIPLQPTDWNIELGLELRG
jgi:hypothetical protein